MQELKGRETGESEEIPSDPWNLEAGPVGWISPA